MIFFWCLFPFSILCAKNVSIETNGTDFKIIAFTDIHFGGGNYPDRVLKIVNNIISLRKPNFVVFTGDQANQPDGIQDLDEIANILTENKIPWAVVFGNHDRDAGLAVESALFESYDEFCLYQRGSLKWDDINGDGSNVEGFFEKYGNYAIDFTENGKPVYTAVFMDSGPVNTGYIEDYQVEWYKALITQKSVEVFGVFDPPSGRVVPSLLLMHQGLPEYQRAADASLGAPDSVGLIPPTVGFGEIGRNHHMQREDVDVGLFAAAKEYGGTHVFCGHDHYNNANMMYEGVQLTYFNKISQNNQEIFPEARVSFATQITLARQADCATAEGCWKVDLTYAMQDGTTTRDCRAWERIGEKKDEGSKKKGLPTYAIVLISIAAAAVVVVVVVVVVLLRKRHSGYSRID